jgi:Tetratricopeptide repeat
MYPLLHLNLGETHRRLGDHDGARAHLDQGRAAAALADDGYGRMIIGGLE